MENTQDSELVQKVLPPATSSPAQPAADIMKEAVEMRRVARELVFAKMGYMADRITASAGRLEAAASRLRQGC